MRLIAIMCAALIAASPSAAQERETLGYGRLFTNDYFGDNDDRWRTGSFVFSIVRGPEWSGELPTAPGAIIEYRLRSEIIAPERLNGAGSDDRPYVGALSAGMHTHFARAGAEISLGVDFVAVGPQTGVADMQDWFHDLVDAPSLSNSVISDQVGNAVYPTALAQVSYPVRLSPDVTLRPFVEAQYGVEDILRVGADVTFGELFQGDLWLRDSTTGHLYSGVEQGSAGTGFVIGADYALVGDSAYFPASFGTTAMDERYRIRAGVHSRLGDGISFFYGATYLSEEYVGQTQGQVVGSLKLDFNF